MHGNTKYKFSELQNIGDRITERPKNMYVLKASFREHNKKRIKDGKPALEVNYFIEGKKVHIVVTNVINNPLTSIK